MRTCSNIFETILGQQAFCGYTEKNCLKHLFLSSEARVKFNDLLSLGIFLCDSL